MFHMVNTLGFLSIALKSFLIYGHQSPKVKLELRLRNGYLLHVSAGYATNHIQIPDRNFRQMT